MPLDTEPDLLAAARIRRAPTSTYSRRAPQVSDTEPVLKRRRVDGPSSEPRDEPDVRQPEPEARPQGTPGRSPSDTQQQPRDAPPASDATSTTPSSLSLPNVSSTPARDATTRRPLVKPSRGPSILDYFKPVLARISTSSSTSGASSEAVRSSTPDVESSLASTPPSSPPVHSEVPLEGPGGRKRRLTTQQDSSRAPKRAERPMRRKDERSQDVDVYDEQRISQGKATVRKTPQRNTRYNNTTEDISSPISRPPSQHTPRTAVNRDGDGLPSARSTPSSALSCIIVAVDGSVSSGVGSTDGSPCSVRTASSSLSAGSNAPSVADSSVSIGNSSTGWSPGRQLLSEASGAALNARAPAAAAATLPNWGKDDQEQDDVGLPSAKTGQGEQKRAAVKSIDMMSWLRRQQQDQATAKVATPKIQTTISLSSRPAFVECRDCGLLYNPLHEADVKLHARRHRAAMRRKAAATTDSDV